MNAADRQGSPSDRGGGKSSTPLAAGSQPEVIEVDDGKAVLVITPALVYDMKGEVYALPADIVQAVDHYTVPDGYRREGSREKSFMLSLGLEEEHEKTSNSAWRTSPAAKKRRRIPAKKATAAT